MGNEHLSTYLNDHLAGSTSAVELLEHLESAHAKTPLGLFAAELRVEVEADRGELRSIMERLDIGESAVRKASGWIGGKAAEVKLRLEDWAGGELHLLESMEVLSLGIEGKRSLWIALAAAAEEAPALRLADYDRLAQRADEQRGRVEEVRRNAARKALVPAP